MQNPWSISDSTALHCDSLSRKFEDDFDPVIDNLPDSKEYLEALGIFIFSVFFKFH